MSNTATANSAPIVAFDEGKIDAILADLDQCRLPGAAVGIAIDGEPVYRKGFGLASMELPVVLSPAVRMRIGSTSKHFTCLAYMLLCEAGKAGIDDPVGKYLPELHPVARQVTLRQLMGNTSGLRDVIDIKLQLSGSSGRPISSSELKDFYRDINDVNAPPGSAWIYNNGGYIILSAVIERITGQPLEDVLQERIFAPTGMRDTLLRRWDTDFTPNSATVHMRNPAGAYQRSYWGVDFAGGAAMVSSVDDMLRWLAHMDTPVVGNAETWTAMRTSQILTNGMPTGYGLGLMTGRYRGIDRLSHAGGWLGGNAQMLKLPAAGLDIVVMVNRHDVSSVSLGNKIVDACLPNLPPRSSSRGDGVSTGVFRSPKTGRVVQLCASSPAPWAQEGRQVISIDGMDMSAEFDETNVLRPTGVFATVKQTVTLVGDPANPRAVRLDDFGHIDEAVAVRRSDSFNKRAFVGQYRSNSTGTEGLITEGGTGLQLKTAGRFGTTLHHLEYLADGIWRARQPDELAGVAILSFDEDGAGFRFSTMYTRALHFRA